MTKQNQTDLTMTKSEVIKLLADECMIDAADEVIITDIDELLVFAQSITKELRRENAEIEQSFRIIEGAMRIVKEENAELTHRLAEQQATLRKAYTYITPLINKESSTIYKLVSQEVAKIIGENGEEELNKLIEEAKRQAVPDGWKMVPVEATNEMIDRASKGWNDFTIKTFSQIYDAMLSAAPQSEGVNK